MNSVPVFPVHTPEQFYQQLVAAKPDPATGKPDPAEAQGVLRRESGNASRFRHG